METRISTSALRLIRQNLMRTFVALFWISPSIQAMDSGSHQTAAMVTVGVLFLGLIAAVIYIRSGSKEDA